MSAMMQKVLREVTVLSYYTTEKTVFGAQARAISIYMKEKNTGLVTLVYKVITNQ